MIKLSQVNARDRNTSTTDDNKNTRVITVSSQKMLFIFLLIRYFVRLYVAQRTTQR